MPRGSQPGERRGGRRKGSRNKRSEGIETYARELLERPAYRAKLETRLEQGTLASGVETLLYHYAYGKPVEPARDDQAFIESLLAVVLKHVGSREAREEIRAVIEAHTTGGPGLRAVA